MYNYCPPARTWRTPTSSSWSSRPGRLNYTNDTPNPPTNIVDFGGFDSSIILM